MIGFILGLLGPAGIALVVLIPALIAVAIGISRRESTRAQLCRDAMRNRQGPVVRD